MLEMQEYAKQEKELTLKRFKHADALVLGSYISKVAVDHNYAIEVYIEVNNQCIYRYVNDGATENNHWWVGRKGAVVKRFGHSSGFITAKYSKQTPQQLAQMYGSEYAFTPGAFPIIVENVGVIGLIGVSGLSSDEDHQLMVDGLTYLKQLQEGE